MDTDKRQALEAAGWKVGDATDFLEVAPSEQARLNMRPCTHRGQEAGFIGCSCQKVEPAYWCNLKDTHCVHQRPEPGCFTLHLFDGSTQWFTLHHPECSTCQVYEPQGNNENEG